MEVQLKCNDCNQTWIIDDTDNVEMTPKNGPYKSSRIRFNFGTISKNLHSCPNCGSSNTKEV